MDPERHARIVALSQTTEQVPASVLREVLAAADRVPAVQKERDELEARCHRLVALQRTQQDTLSVLQAEADGWRPKLNAAVKRAGDAERQLQAANEELERRRHEVAPYQQAVADAEGRLQELEAKVEESHTVVRRYKEDHVKWRHDQDERDAKIKHLAQFHADANRLAKFIIANAVGDDPERTHVLDLHDRLG